jgi:hypothetical protein
MPESPVRAPSQAAFEVAAPSTRAPVIIAAVGIGLAALFGLYRGLVSVHAPTEGQKDANTTSAIANAAPAVALPHDPDWSTLSGPKVLPPVAVKAKPDANAADSADADDQPSQAEQAADASLDTPTPTPAPVKVAPPQAPPANLSSVAPY